MCDPLRGLILKKYIVLLEEGGYDFGGISHVKVDFIALPENICPSEELTYQIYSPNSKHIIYAYLSVLEICMFRVPNISILPNKTRHPYG